MSPEFIRLGLEQKVRSARQWLENQTLCLKAAQNEYDRAQERLREAKTQLQEHKDRK